MLKRTVFITTTILFLAVASHINASNVNLQTQQPKETSPVVVQEINLTKSEINQASQDAKVISYKEVSPIKMVLQPDKYLNKQIKFKAKFDKFSALGLDYAPTNRDSKKYISFLIKRENVTNYNIPLSELKLFLKRDYAEKELVNLESGDEIEVYGNVFSNALGDPWVDADKVVILTAKNSDKKAADDKSAATETKDNESNKGK